MAAKKNTTKKNTSGSTAKKRLAAKVKKLPRPTKNWERNSRTSQTRLPTLTIRIFISNSDRR